jgi:polyhydroxybutyrate depolymerase
VRRLAPTILACLIAGLAAAGGASAAPAQAGCQRALVPGDQTVTLSSGGLERTALVHLPAQPPAKLLPVVVALHGAAQNGAFFAGYTGFSEIADAEDFVAVYPDALPAASFRDRPFWNISSSDPHAADDVRFISDLLDLLHRSACTNPLRVFATGVSNGAGMAARLGCQLSGRFAAIAPVSGGYGAQPPCAPVRPVSVLEIHGAQDSVVPYGGSGPAAAGAVLPYLNRWLGWDGCTGQPAARLVAPRATELRWTACRSGAAVWHVRISGGAHQLPGGNPPDYGPAATFDAPWLIWDFFRTHARG